MAPWRELPHSVVSGAQNPRGHAGWQVLLTGVVEADETYLTPKKPRKGRPYLEKDKRDVVLGMIERRETGSD